MSIETSKMLRCHKCCTHKGGSNANLPLVCLVPRDEGHASTARASTPKASPTPSRSTVEHEFTPLSEEYLRKHFKFPQRALYLDPFNRPLITFPMTQEKTKHINQYRKSKINQGILDGVIHPSKAIWAPTVFPYAETAKDQNKLDEDDVDEEIIYLLQLPDYETSCPIHGQAVKIPRFVWHSQKKAEKPKQPPEVEGSGYIVGGMLNKPKPWLLSRLTDFDLDSQW